MRNPNLSKEHQQMQAELYARIEAEHRKERDRSLLLKLKLICFGGLVLVGLVGYAKCEAAQRQNEKPQTEINHNSINQ